MNEHPLFDRLQGVSGRLHWQRVARRLAILWTASAVASFLALAGLRALGVPTPWPAVGLAVVLSAATVFELARSRRRPVDPRLAAHAVEAAYPALNGLLVTAAQQTPEPGTGYGFLQRRVLDGALAHARRNDWSRVVPNSRLLALHAGQGLALLALAAALALGHRPPRANAPMARLLARAAGGIEITPGDVELERGSSLVVLARFGGAGPRGADLVLGSGARMPLVRNLDDALFGGTVADVATNFVYRVEHDGTRSRDYRVIVFEYPRLERSVVDLAFPAYTGKASRHVDDTRRVSAVEGTRLDLALQLNKPVARAFLQPHAGGLSNLVLAADSNRPVATLSGHVLAVAATYDLRLVDADGRTNKVVPQFVFDVATNRVPELKLALPRGDVRPTVLEEIAFEGTAWDDFGMPAYGLGLVRVGAEPEYIELGRGVAGGTRQPFRHLVRLEELGAKTDQVLGWFLWADDIGPDGQPRRTTGDIYFAEIRPFDEIFREGEGGGGNEEQAGGQPAGEQGGNPTAKLAQLQKQIIAATWKLQSRRRSSASSAPLPPAKAPPPPKPTGGTRSGIDTLWTPLARSFAAQGADRAESASPTPRPGRTAPRAAIPPATGRFEDDLAVVEQAAAQALEQARGAMEEQADPRQRALWSSAVGQMERALEQLRKAAGNRDALRVAIEAEQAALQSLLQLQAKETEVTRSRSKSRGQSGSRQAGQRQLDELELTQSEDRYETQRQARAPQDEQRREQAQAANRLAELARRQQDVNERLKELQVALQAAADETQRAELRRELKRLQEEQRRNLADADELRQRMERPENQSRMSGQRQRLDETRDEMQKAADATGEGKVSQALAAGTRAERQLRDLREDLRRQNAGEFTEAARDLRNEARDLAREQSEIRRELDQPTAGPRPLAEDGTRRKLLERIASQESKLTNLVERATRLSEQAENSEPLLSRQLYDTLRKFAQDDGGNLKQMREQLIRRGQMSRALNTRLDDAAQSGAKSLATARELLRQGIDEPGRDAEQRARAGIDALRQGIEQASNAVLGDDTDALRRAQGEIDDAVNRLRREMEADRGTTDTNAPPSPGIAAKEAGSWKSGSSPGSGAAGRTDRDDQPGQPGQAPPSGRPGEPSQPGQGQPRGESASTDPSTPGRARSPGDRAEAPRPGGNQPGGNQPGQPAAAPGPGANRPGAGKRDPNRAPDSQRQPGGGNLDLGGILGNDRSGGGGSLNGSGGPLTGEEFGEWSDRLRDAEELVDFPDLRNGIANARDQARRVRVESRRDRRKPDWAVVESQVIRPLAEVRDRIREELSRRAADDPMVPLDRDPVPGRYSELVRRYYEELGRDK